MTRVAIVIAILCVLAGAIYASYESYRKKELELKYLEVAAGPCYLVARRDVMVGSIIRECDIMAMPPPFKPAKPTPLQYAFRKSQKGAVIGRRAKYGLSTGQLILESQLMPR